MFDADKLLGRVLGGGAASGLLGGLLGSGAMGMLGGKRGRKMAPQVLKYGAIAAVGALAYHAYTRHKAGQPLGWPGSGDQAAPAMPPPGSGFLPAPTDRDALQSVGVTMIRAMIAAAKADGEIDAVEAQRVFAQQERLGLDSEEKSFLLQELSKPADLEALVRAATTPQLAAEVYTASLMAIEVSNPAESAYLQLLASRLRLEPALVTELHRAVAENVNA